ncbi:MAG TPA: hypothetical protein VE783_10480 [Candidatus Limnocylindrales bacterium]|nr:hypothetical protein [Candidatus Limnocylindrales bacterium]
MSAVRKVMSYILLAVLAGNWSQTAAAQFEIAPDHFQEWPDSYSQKKLATTLNVDQEQLAAAQQELANCQALLEEQATAVEQARDSAVGSGAMGDLASIYLDQQNTESVRLQALERQLAPRMALARAILQGSQAAQTVMAKASKTR